MKETRDENLTDNEPDKEDDLTDKKLNEAISENQRDSDPQVLRAVELAAKLRVKPSTVKQMWERGEIPGWQTAKGVLFYWPAIKQRLLEYAPEEVQQAARKREEGYRRSRARSSNSPKSG